MRKLTSDFLTFKTNKNAIKVPTMKDLKLKLENQKKYTFKPRINEIS